MNTELTQLAYDIAYYYTIFCLVTAICILYLNVKIFRIARPGLNTYGTFVYFSITGLMATLFAPVYFIVFLFYSKRYVESAAETITEVMERQQNND